MTGPTENEKLLPTEEQLEKAKAELAKGCTISVAALIVCFIAVAVYRSIASEHPRPATVAAPNSTANRTEIRGVKEQMSPADVAREARQKTAKVKELLASERRTARSNVEVRLALWKGIVALDGGNKIYEKKRNDLQSEVDEVAELVKLPSSGAVVVNVRPRKEGFGNVLVIDITIRNRGLSNLKDFNILCTNYGASGTVIDTNSRTIFEIINSRVARTFKSINMGFINGQTTNTGCIIESAIAF